MARTGVGDARDVSLMERFYVFPGALHRVAVLVLDGAKPLDVGIPAQVFTNRPGMPYEVHVCGAAPGPAGHDVGKPCRENYAA